jgi:hypothetical protein
MLIVERAHGIEVGGHALSEQLESAYDVAAPLREKCSAVTSAIFHAELEAVLNIIAIITASWLVRRENVRKLGESFEGSTAAKTPRAHEAQIC